MLERLYDGQTAQVAARLARHFELGGQIEKAARYRLAAGQRALQLSAPDAALRHLAKGLELLGTLPDSAVRQELELLTQAALGTAHTTIGNFTAHGGVPALERAAELAVELESGFQLFPILRGLVAQFLVRADFPAGMQQANRLLTMADVLRDEHLLALAHSSMGVLQFYTAEFEAGRSHLELAIAGLSQTREPVGAYAHDPYVSSLNHLALVLWSLGFPDQALARNLEALAIAEQMEHPPTLAHALEMAATIRCFRREWAASCAMAEAAMDLATRERLPFWLAVAATQRATALIELGRVTEGTRLMEENLAALEALGSNFALPQLLGDVAQARALTGDYGGALMLVDRALAIGEETGERWWETELLRRRGDLLLAIQPCDEAGAEECYRRARELAQARQARSLELRACVSLGRLLLRQGNRAAAIGLVAPVYGWFAEGFATADLQDAAALLAS
ncbi:MAG: hypothetical protein M9936_29215 [Caldilinea sp.]|nr:hypothetical protein [Caldilinea sp.]